MRILSVFLAMTLLSTAATADPIVDRLQLWGCLDTPFAEAGVLKQRTAIRCFQEQLGSTANGELSETDRKALAEHSPGGQSPDQHASSVITGTWEHRRDNGGDYAIFTGGPAITLVCTGARSEPPLYFQTGIRNVRENEDVTLRFDGLIRLLKTPEGQLTGYGARVVFQEGWQETLRELSLSADYSSYIELKFPQTAARLSTNGLVNALAAFDPDCGTPTASGTTLAIAQSTPAIGFPYQVAPGFNLELTLLDRADGLLRIERADTPYLIALGLTVGDVITEVRRFDPYVTTAKDAEEARDFLMNASGQQSFEIVLKSTRPGVPARSVDLNTPIAVGDLKLSGVENAHVLAQIRSGDMDMARQSNNNDQDIRRGREHFLNGLFVHYHNVFGTQCFQTDLGPFDILTERVDTIFHSNLTGVTTPIRGQEFEYRIRSRYVPLYNRAKVLTPGLRGYWRNLDLAGLPDDLRRFISLNGCDSPELRIFEDNFFRAVQR